MKETHIFSLSQILFYCNAIHLGQNSWWIEESVWGNAGGHRLSSKHFKVAGNVLLFLYWNTFTGEVSDMLALVHFSTTFRFL